MKVTLEHQPGDFMQYDCVVFTEPAESIDDWCSVLRIIADLSSWTTDMLLVQSAMEVDLSRLYVGAWAKDNKAAMIDFRDRLSEVISKIGDDAE